MGLTGEEKKKYQREYMKRKRSNIGSNKPDGSNKGLTEGVTGNWKIIPAGKGVTIPDIVDKLTELPFSKAKQAKGELPGTVWSEPKKV